VIYPTYFQITEDMGMIHDEPQRIYVFENGYAASVVKLKLMFGQPGYEIAVMKNFGSDREDLDDDSIRAGLTEEEVQTYLEEIKSYEKI
jgi:hypothetical protein